MKIVLSLFQISQYNNKTKLLDVPFPFDRKSTELQLPWWETPEDRRKFVWNTWDWSTSSSLVETPTRTQIIQSLHSHVKQRSTPSLGRTYHKWSWWEETKQREWANRIWWIEWIVCLKNKPTTLLLLLLISWNWWKGGGGGGVQACRRREFSLYRIWSVAEDRHDLMRWGGGGGGGQGRKEGAS